MNDDYSATSVSDDLWVEVEKLLPASERTAAKPQRRKPKPARLVFDAIVYLLANGTAWGQIPGQVYGSASAIFKRYQDWKSDGFFERLMHSGILIGTPLDTLPWRRIMSAREDQASDQPEFRTRKAIASKERRRLSVRRRITEAASKLYQENGGDEGDGFDRTTVEDIAREAGISVRTFFRHFPTKADAIFVDWSYINQWYAGALMNEASHNPLLDTLVPLFNGFDEAAESPITWQRLSRSYRSPGHDVRRAPYIDQLRRNIIALRCTADPSNRAYDRQVKLSAALVAAIMDNIDDLAMGPTGDLHEDVLRREVLVALEELASLASDAVTRLQEQAPTRDSEPHPRRTRRKARPGDADPE